MFQDRIKQLRKEKGISQTELARVFNVTQSAIAMWESGKNNPDLPMLLKIAEYFGVSVDYLTGRTEEKGLAIPPDSKPHMNEIIIYARDGRTQRREYTDEKFKQIIAMIKLLGHEDSDL